MKGKIALDMVDLVVAPVALELHHLLPQAQEIETQETILVVARLEEDVITIIALVFEFMSYIWKSDNSKLGEDR